MMCGPDPHQGQSHHPNHQQQYYENTEMKGKTATVYKNCICVYNFLCKYVTIYNYKMWHTY